MANVGIRTDEATRDFGEQFVEVTGTTVGDKRAMDVNVVATSGGAGTEYTEGDTDATITGPAVLAEGPSETLTPLQVDASKNLKVAIQGTPTVALDSASLVALEDINVTVTVAPEIEIKNDSGNPVPISGTVTVQDGGGSITVDNAGTFAVQADTELTTADLDTGGGTDTRAVVGLVGSASGGGQLIPGSSTDGLLVNLGANNDVTVTGSVTANAGTNLNTSALALESGGNLAGAAASLATIDDWDETDRAKVNPIVGNAGVTGNTGTVDAGTQRVTLATNVALPTGTNTIGAVNLGEMASISSANSRANANLAGAGVFTGSYEDISQYAGFTLGILDAGANGGTLVIDWSEDGTNSRDTDTVVVPTANGQQVTWGRKWRYFRVTYTHGAGAGNVVIQTILNKVFLTQSTHFGSDTISTSQDGPVVHAMLRGLSGSNFVNLAADSNNALTVSNVTANKVATPTLTNVAASASSVTLLSATSTRRQVILVNDSAAICYVKFGTTASTSSYTVQMPAIASGVASHLFIDENPVYTGRIDAIWASATGNMRITEIAT